MFIALEEFNILEIAAGCNFPLYPLLDKSTVQAL
jgi:hypothetical protein